jgi:predicted adenylyl cyclase CyaB
LPRNLELKVRCDLEKHTAILEQLRNTQHIQPIEIKQRDTYFSVASGRLKLRELTTGDSITAELIQYARPDCSGMRLSTYRRIEIAADQARAMCEAMIDACGMLTTVSKKRSVLIWNATRIHLDDVDSLGHFIELETVLSESDKSGEVGQKEYEHVVDMLGLGNLESVSGSYSDLMIEKELAK